MLSRLLRKRSHDQGALRAAPSVPDGTVVWAVGDIHGRLDLLVPLVEAIRRDADRSDAQRKVGVFLGDYIDRGPDSRGVLDHLARLTPEDVEWRFLKGNHEEAMLQFLVDPPFGSQWCEYGGDATLTSYGLRPPQMRHRAEGWKSLSADLSHRVSADELAFLRALEPALTIGDYFFAHAGARPGVPLDQQSERDLLWVRRSFLDNDTVFERMIVHGHTPTDEVHVDHRRVGIDTRAYASGVLTCLRLEKDRRDLIQTRSDDDATVTCVMRRAA